MNPERRRLRRSDSDTTRRDRTARSSPFSPDPDSCSTALRMEASGFLISWAREALSSATASSRSVRRFSTFRRSWPVMSWKMAVTDGGVPVIPLQDRGADTQEPTRPAPRRAMDFSLAMGSPRARDVWRADPIPGATFSTASTTSLPRHSSNARSRRPSPAGFRYMRCPAASTVMTPVPMFARMSPVSNRSWRRADSMRPTAKPGPPDPVTQEPGHEGHGGKQPHLQEDLQLEVPWFHTYSDPQVEEGGQYAQKHAPRKGEQ